MSDLDVTRSDWRPRADTHWRKLAATGAKVAGRTIDIANNANVRISGIATHGAGQVTGTAMREGERFSGAMIVLVPQDPGNNLPLFRRDQSDSDGTFTLANMVPGQYRWWRLRMAGT